MGNNLRVCTIVGTRPEIIRLSATIERLRQDVEHTLIHTGQNYDYELNQLFFEDLRIPPPDYYLNAAGETASATIGLILSKVDALLRVVQPDAVLVLGDTNSCLAAIAAKRLKIPVFHMEAGNRCFDERVPEEINRRIIDHIADINLTYSQLAREYLISEGRPPERSICIGSPMREVLNRQHARIEGSAVLSRFGLAARQYFAVSLHREENVDGHNQLMRIMKVLEGVYSEYKEPVIVSAHPRLRKRIEEFGVEVPAGVRLASPFSYSDYVCLQKHAHATLSDSGTITEESSILAFPALNLREAHERPEGMEEGAVMMTGLDLETVLLALRVLERGFAEKSLRMREVRDYLPDNVSEKVVRIIISYTSYVRRVVWRRYESQAAFGR